MKDGKTVIINNREYTYDSDNKSYNGKTDDVPAVICAICNNDKFQIAYGNYECIAVCQCGNRITVYDG